HRYAEEGDPDGPQARGPLAESKDGIQRSRCPVLQRRFLEILQPIEPGSDPVARCSHLPRGFGVPALVRIQKRANGHGSEPQRAEDDPKQPSLLLPPLPTPT